MRPDELPAFFDGLERWAGERDGQAEVLAYGEHEDQVIELRGPSTTQAQPLAIVLHGW